jgi:hypothetical protein
MKFIPGGSGAMSAEIVELWLTSIVPDFMNIPGPLMTYEIVLRLIPGATSSAIRTPPTSPVRVGPSFSQAAQEIVSAAQVIAKNRVPAFVMRATRCKAESTRRAGPKAAPPAVLRAPGAA